MMDSDWESSVESERGVGYSKVKRVFKGVHQQKENRKDNDKDTRMASNTADNTIIIPLPY